MLRVVRLVFLLAGCALGAYVLYANAGSVAAALARVGWGIGPFILTSFLIHALDAWAWRWALPQNAPSPGLPRLIWARLAGEAVNKVTPLASLGGEPLKGYLLSRAGIPLPEALGSVLIAKNVITQAQILFIYGGAALGLVLAPAAARVYAGLCTFPTLVLLLMAGVGIADLHLRRRPAASATARRPSRAVELWAQFADFFWSNPRGFALSFLLFLAGWGAGALELLVGSWLLGFPLAPERALVLEALLVSANMATFLVPANAGTQEGAFAWLSPLLGLSTPHGLALAVLRRSRDLLWIAVGLAYLALTEGRIILSPDLPTPPTGV
jgi:hypothetical protein